MGVVIEICVNYPGGPLNQSDWHIHIPTGRGDIIGRRLLPGFPHLTSRENFPTWKHLVTEPPSAPAVLRRVPGVHAQPLCPLPLPRL
jgi:hypothetical protein